MAAARPYPTIPGLEFVEELGRGTRTVVYRACRHGRSYAVKVQRDRAPEVQRQFRREAATMARLHHPGLAEIVEVGHTDGAAWLVMEYVEGTTLASMLQSTRLPLGRVLAITREVANILDTVHRSGLIHRDVKPRNILVDTQGRARLIDFGLAAGVTEFAEITQFAGSFQYSAPEQTGMLQRPVDGRADLYALGVVLYECVSGQPPFQSTDPATLIQLHAHTSPPPLEAVAPGVPPGLARVVDKLLAKDPDDRYQSGRGLSADLAHVADLDRRPLGRDDRRPPPPDLDLAVRQVELGTLAMHLGHATGGEGRLVLIEGRSGSGKSLLARHLLARADEASVPSVHVRCHEDNPVPYAPVRDLLAELASSPRTTLIREAAGPDSDIVAALCPELARVLEARPPDELDAEAFQGAVARFVLRVAHALGGLLVVLEDLHWLDEATLRVLCRLAEGLPRSPLLLVATARPEVTHDDLSSALGHCFRDVHHLPLRSLDRSQVADLVSSHLGGGTIDERLVEQIAVRANGSPFAVSEFVRAALEAGAVRPAWGTWVLDTDALEDLDLPDDVIDLVLERIDRLGPEAREVLAAAAVVGTRFGSELPGRVLDREVHEALLEAVRVRVLESRPGGELVFVHNRVRERLLDGLDADRRRDLHQRVAEALESEEGGSARLYALAWHYYHGHRERNPRRVFSANLEAGLLARREYAAERAWDFLVRAQEARSTASLPHDAVLSRALGETAAHIGHLHDAEGHLHGALEHTDDPIAQARIHSALADLHLWGWIDTRRAREDINAALAAVGEHLPRTLLRRVLSVGRFLLAGAAVRLLRRPPLTDRSLAVVEVRSLLYTLLSGVGFFEMDALVFAESTARQYYTVARVPPSRAQVDGYMALALTGAILGVPSLAHGWADKAVASAQAAQDRWSLASAWLYRGFALHQLGESLAAEEAVRHALEVHGRWLETVDYLLGTSDLAWNLLLRGQPMAARLWSEAGRDRVEDAHAGDVVSAHALFIYQASAEALLGRTTDAHATLAHIRDILQDNDHISYWIAEHTVHAVFVQLESGELGAPLDEALDRLDALGLRPLTAVFHLKAAYVFTAAARSAQAWAAAPADRPRRVRQLRDALGPLRRAGSTDLFRSYLALYQASLALLEGSEARAESFLERAERLADRCDNAMVLAEVHRHRATLLQSRGNEPAALRHAIAATHLAADLGWSRRLREYRRELAAHGHTTGQTSTSKRHGVQSAERADQYLQALLQVSLAATRARTTREQAHFALDEVVRLMGAERAYLFDVTRGRSKLYLGRSAGGVDLTEPTRYGSTLVERVAETGDLLVVSGTDEGRELGSESAVAYGLRSIMVAPLRVGDRTTGVLYLDTRVARGVFTDDDARLLEAVANQLAVSFERSRLQEQVAEQEEQRKALERFHAPEVVRRLIMQRQADEGLRNRDGRFLEVVDATILFCDLSDFTRFCDAHDAEAVARLLNTYLSRMTEIAFAYHGTVDKYIGDSVMCIFGAPFSDEDDALRAAHCALDMRRSFDQLTASGETGPGTSHMQVHLGLNTGQVVAGTVGSAQRMEYTALGDTVNTAARLQGLAVPGQILVGPRTAELIRAEFELSPLGRVQVKGKAEGVEAYALLGTRATQDLADELETWPPER